MITFLIFSVGIALTVFGIENAAIFAVAVFCVAASLVRLGADEDSEVDDLEVSRGIEFWCFLPFSALVIGGLALWHYTDKIIKWPDAIDPPDSLRLGESDFYENAFSLEDIETALALADELVPSTVINYGDTLLFLSVLLPIYFGFIAFNKRWNNNGFVTLVMLSLVMGGGIFFKGQFQDTMTSPTFEVADSIRAKLYPSSYDDCDNRYGITSGTDASLERKNKTESFIVDTPVGGTVVSVTSDDREWAYTSAKKSFLAMNQSVFLRVCDDSAAEYATWGHICPTYAQCISAVQVNSGRSSTYKLLSYNEVEQIID